MDKALRRSTHLVAPTPPASDLSDAAKAWYTRIAPQPTVHGKIQGLAAVRAEAKAEGIAEQIKALRSKDQPIYDAAADFLEQLNPA
jgi:hypothetical protein